jgi:uncharacterized circularly permuted ATP-grasp superfamily protein
VLSCIHAYDTTGFFDEMFEADGRRAGAALLVQHTRITRKRTHTAPALEQALLHLGITFNVYGDAAGTERIFLST